MRFNFLEKDIAEMIRLYKKGLSCEKIGEIFKCSGANINKKIKSLVKFRKAGDWTRKYHCNDDFFKKIDSKEKAYWLGFLFADGCITDRGVNLLLQLSDKDSIEKFKIAIEADNPIEVRHDKIKKTDGILDFQHTAKIRISSEKIKEDLNKLGCVRRKTDILRFPESFQVSDNFINSFMLGYFDGNGSAWSFKTGKYLKIGVSITSARPFLEKYLQKLLQLNPEIKASINNHPSPGFSILSISEIKSIRLFKEFLYKDAPVYMERKFEKINSFPTSSMFDRKQDLIKKIYNIFLDKKLHSDKELANNLDLNFTYVSNITRELRKSNKLKKIKNKKENCLYHILNTDETFSEQHKIS